MCFTLPSPSTIVTIVCEHLSFLQIHPSKFQHTRFNSWELWHYCVDFLADDTRFVLLFTHFTHWKKSIFYWFFIEISTNITQGNATGRKFNLQSSSKVSTLFHNIVESRECWNHLGNIFIDFFFLWTLELFYYSTLLTRISTWIYSRTMTINHDSMNYRTWLFLHFSPSSLIWNVKKYRNLIMKKEKRQRELLLKYLKIWLWENEIVLKVVGCNWSWKRSLSYSIELSKHFFSLSCILYFPIWCDLIFLSSLLYAQITSSCTSNNFFIIIINLSNSEISIFFLWTLL